MCIKLFKNTGSAKEKNLYFPQFKEKHSKDKSQMTKSPPPVMARKTF